MLIDYSMFYKRYGVRNIIQLFRPRIANISALPKMSMLHWASTNLIENTKIDKEVEVDDLYLNPDYFLFNEYKKIYVDYITELTAYEGSARRKPLVVLPVIRKFHMSNRKFLYTKSAVKVIESPMKLVVYNYNFIYALHKYITQPLLFYWKWYNFTHTLYSTINTISAESPRNQFLVIDVNEFIPSYTAIKIFMRKDINTALIKVFDSSFKLFLLDLFKFIHEDTREKSLLNLISKDKYQFVNFIFRTPDGMCSVLNLGYLNSMLKDQPNVTELKTLTQVNSNYLAKLLITYLDKHRAITLKDTDVVDDTYTEKKDRTITDDTDVESTDLDDIYTDDNDYREDENSVNTDTTPIVTNDTLAIPDIDLDNDNDLEYEDIDISRMEKDVDEIVDHNDKTFIKQLHFNNIELTNNGEVQVTENTSPVYDEVKEQLYFNKTSDITYRLKLKAEELQQDGFLSSSEVKTFLKNLSNVKIEEVPLTLDKKSDVTLNTEPVSSSYTKTTLDDYDYSYDDKILDKDISNCITYLQKSYVAVKNYNKETVKSILGDYDQYTITFSPIDGADSTIHFKLPKINEDGYFIANGKKCIMRKQIVDMPIRKISPTEVQLSSYYGKIFIHRSRTRSDSYIYKVMKKINSTVGPDSFITKVSLGDNFSYDKTYSYEYGSLASVYRSILTTEFKLLFNQSDLKEEFGDNIDIVSNYKKELQLCGVTNNNEPIYISSRNVYYKLSEGQLVTLGSIKDLLKLDIKDKDIYSDHCVIKIYSRYIPLVLVLLYFIGIRHLLVKLGVKYRLIDKEEYSRKDNNGMTYIFKDKVLIIDKDNSLANILMFSGLSSVEKSLVTYTFSSMDTKDSVSAIFYGMGLNATYIKELESQESMFIDPITESVLESVKEPTSYLGLIIRANELLTDYSCPHPQNISNLRIRGNERIAGYIYKELSHAIRDYRNRNISFKSKVELGNYKIWDTIVKDNTVKLAEETNPIQTLKEKEIVTYVGEGGRSKESMPKNTRSFHSSFTGVISEATVDSSDVGINSYLTPNSNISNIRGMIDVDNKDIDSITSVLSTTAVLSPFSVYDDPKRINFINIQNSHVIGCPSYTKPYVLTGYDYIVPKRHTSRLFSYTARQNGTVRLVTDKVIVIEYEDRTMDHIEIGTIYGRSEGKTYSHFIKTDLKIGDTVKKNDVVSYNSVFFTKDPLTKDYILTSSIIARVALLESYYTYEDSSALSENLSKRLNAETIKERSIVVNFNQRLSNVKKIGDKVEADTPLMIIEDELSSNLNIFSEKQLEALADISKQLPKSKYNGVIEHMEVFYHGEKDDMNPSIRALADMSDRLLAKKYLSKEVTGSVNDSYSVSGKPLQLNTCEIKFYIRKLNKMYAGDKIIFANQLKSVVGEVLNYKVFDDMGKEVDALFGMRSVAARIVMSPFLIGTTSTLLRLVGEKALTIFKGK